MGRPLWTPGAQANGATRRPVVIPDGPLDGHGRLDRRGRMLEDGEELIGPGVNLVAAGAPHRAADEAARIGQQRCVAVAEALHQSGRVLDVGQQERHRAGGQDALALPAELAVHEADRHDPVLLGGPQQPPPGAVAGLVVLELDLAESGQGVANVRFVVDRQASPAMRIDVGEGAVAQRPALPGAECGHVKMVSVPMGGVLRG